MELHLKIELPAAVTNIAGNADEGTQIIKNNEQIDNHHSAAAYQVKIPGVIAGRVKTLKDGLL